MAASITKDYTTAVVTNGYTTEVTDADEYAARGIVMKSQQELPNCQQGTQEVILRGTEEPNAYSVRAMGSIYAFNGPAAVTERAGECANTAPIPSPTALYNRGTLQPPAYSQDWVQVATQIRTFRNRMPSSQI